MPFVLPTDIGARPVTVVGAGTLGRRIALMFATRGRVRIYDPARQTAQDAVAYVARHVGETARHVGSDTPGEATAVTDLGEAVADAWLVVEAVPERLPPRQAAVDLMSCGKTGRDVLDLLLRELPRYGVHPFEAHRESTGFIFNRIWAAIKRESLAVVAEGVSTPRDVDRMWQINTGLKSGPFRLMDKVGLDVVLDIENHYADENPALPTGPRELLRRHVDAGHLGVKTGRGFYDDYGAQG
ncbi:3-hydroxyacyl-CoA dehydrogenase family protein [Streptomyces sp. NPDC085995]|uniref:3-hydroxyacyl-CoA dehydrogenase family protein n=1 Tax=Streptomyces sp. NPDC085995 TaxID=3154861 RepID=UPI00341AC2F0